MIKIQEFKRINLFKDMPDNLLEIIGAEAQISIFSTKKQLFKENDIVDNFYMLLMGQISMEVKLSSKITVTLETIQSGSCFGLSSLVPKAKVFSSAICQEPCEIITLPGQRMMQLFQDNNEFGYEIMLRLARSYKQKMNNRIKMIMTILDENPELKNQADDLKSLTLSIF
ncbi:MAG: hypothetical protein B6I26_05380 [Desulfobacteraceae bacterium 4572_130]|nr:MAG: hypothetical protein B6I26_05380 [Desulfobacteraceae bacterium 4572_130]